MQTFDWSILTDHDRSRAAEILGVRPDLGEALRDPDLVIAPDGSPYLYRWHVIPRNYYANVYLHIQVASDPERPLHDHPWDNTSVILSGGYDEVFGGLTHPTYPNAVPAQGRSVIYQRRTGDVIHRQAERLHRLLLPPQHPYTMTLFCTGPHRRSWGFMFPEGWVPAKEVVGVDDNVSTMVKQEIAQ